MTIFYTVDRLTSLNENLSIQLISYQDISPKELQDHVNDMFPDGVSKHGDTYFLKNKSLGKVINSNIELLFEYVRRTKYIDKPSRFQSFFAFEKKEDALNFKQKYGNPDNLVWEVEGKNYFKADMNLLILGASILQISYLANQYWQGNSSDNPVWEILLKPPIHMRKKINL